VGYIDGATNQRDPLFDAITKINNQFKLYSRDENNYYKIQGRGLPFEITDVVPLGIEIMESGTYRIGLAFVDEIFSNGQSIYLRDKYLNIVHELQNSFYEFVTSAGVFNNRFEIIYQNTTLGVSIYDQTKLKVFRNLYKSVEIISSDFPVEEVFVFDMIGRTLFHSTYKNKSNRLEIPGIYCDNLIIKVKINGHYHVFKIR
jgi:hypothetical protein